MKGNGSRATDRPDDQGRSSAETSADAGRGRRGTFWTGRALYRYFYRTTAGLAPMPLISSKAMRAMGPTLAISVPSSPRCSLDAKTSG